MTGVTAAGSLVQLFDRANSGALDPLTALLSDVVSQARAAWPALNVSTDAFVRHLDRHLAPPHEASLLAVRGADLFIALGCAMGDATSLASFDATFGSELSHVGRKLRRGQAESDDFVQECRQKLFAPPKPKIADYSGHGDLRHWLRVTLMRALVDHQRANKLREQRERADGEPLEIPDMRDPELEHLKHHFRAEFRAAFEEAARALDAADRVMLRQHFAEGLTIDALATIHHIHRATAARRVLRARDALFGETRRRLMTKLVLGRDELDSAMRLIESNVHGHPRARAPIPKRESSIPEQLTP